jgi:hypothetical protein
LATFNIKMVRLVNSAIAAQARPGWSISPPALHVELLLPP